MQDRVSFEYAVLRVVPRVEREEFINVGVVMFCAAQRFLQMRYQLDENKLKCLCNEIDINELEGYFKAFELICKGDKQCGGPMARLPIAGRFRWLTATRSTVLQTSKVHPGLCTNAQHTFDAIYKEQVL